MAYSSRLYAVRTVWPFAGREAELAAVRKAVRGGGIVVAGAPGVGKSRLVAQALHGLEGFTVASVRATEAAAELPFGAFAHLLPTASAQQVNPLQWAAGELLADRLLLAVDDAHLLDPASAALVHHLVLYGGAKLIATVRTGAPASDAVIALWKDDLVPRLDLAPLSTKETAQALEAVLGGPVDDHTLRGLWQVSEGNPLFLRELVLAGRATGALAVRAEMWRWAGELAVTTRLRELVDQRIGAVTQAEREVLELVAYGEPVGAELLAALVSPSVVDALEDRQLIVVSPESRRLLVRLAHPLYGQAVRARCGTLRARGVLRRLADAVEAAGLRRREDSMRVAVWRLDSGTAADPRMLLDACGMARLGRDLTLAERLARAALAAGGGAEASLQLSRVLHYLDRYEEAEQALEEVRPEDVGQRLDYVAARTFNLCWGLGREAEAQAVLDEALVTMSGPRPRQAVGLLKAVLHCFSGNLGEAQAGLDRVLAMGPLDELALLSAMPLRAGIQAFDGRAEKALAIVEQHPSEAFPSYRATMLEFATHAALLLGDLKAADGYAAEGFRLGEEYGAWNRALVGFGTVRARVRRLRGQLDEALRLSREAAARLPRRSQFAGPCLAELAVVQALRGDAAAADDALRAAAEVTVAVGHHTAFPLRLARVWVFAAGGDVAAAVRQALDTAALAQAEGLRAYEVTALHDAVRLGAAPLAAPRLAELVEQVDGPLVVLCSRHAAACAAKDAAALDTVSAEFEALGLLVHAAEAAAQAAAAHDQAGRPRPAQAARTRAWTIAHRCQGARTPALVDLLLPKLTGRQREIAGLAGKGLTNREIADLLTLSTRTVANHLVAVYERLGVHDRAALAEILNHFT